MSDAEQCGCRRGLYLCEEGQRLWAAVIAARQEALRRRHGDYWVQFRAALAEYQRHVGERD